MKYRKWGKIHWAKYSRFQPILNYIVASYIKCLIQQYKYSYNVSFLLRFLQHIFSRGLCPLTLLKLPMLAMYHICDYFIIYAINVQLAVKILGMIQLTQLASQLAIHTLHKDINVRCCIGSQLSSQCHVATVGPRLSKYLCATSM